MVAGVCSHLQRLVEQLLAFLTRLDVQLVSASDLLCQALDAALAAESAQIDARSAAARLQLDSHLLWSVD